MRELSGIRVLLTRTEAGCEAWAERIREANGEAEALPCLRIEDVEVDESELAVALERARWIAFSSRRGVDRLLELGRPSERCRLAAVGPATAGAVRSAWGRVDLVAPEATAASLGRTLVDRIGVGHDARVVTIAAAGGRDDLEEVLHAASIPVDRFELYRTRWRPGPHERRRRLRGPRTAVLLASPSAARGLAARADVGDDVAVITIGPSTTAAARKAGLRVTAEADQRSLEGLLEAIP